MRGIHFNPSQLDSCINETEILLQSLGLAKEAQKYADNIWYVPDIGKAVKMAKETAKESDVILAVGSLSYLKEVKKALGQG